MPLLSHIRGNRDNNRTRMGGICRQVECPSELNAIAKRDATPPAQTDPVRLRSLELLRFHHGLHVLQAVRPRSSLFMSVRQAPNGTVSLSQFPRIPFGE